MEKLKGLKIDKLDFTLNKKGDFLFIEGPFLSHFFDDQGNDYLMLWVDSDSKHNRWLLFKTETLKIYEYLSKTYSLKKLLEISNYEIIYFMDIDNEGNHKKIILTIKDNIPKDYLPQTKSLFNEDYAEKYAILLKEELSNAFTVSRNLNELPITTKAENPKSKNKTKHYKLLFKNNNIRSSHFQILALKSTQLAIQIHCEIYKDSGYKHLMSIHNSAYTNSVHLELYFTELNRLLENKESISSMHQVNFTTVFEKLITSTIQIVKNNPNKYLPVFNIWRTEILSFEESIIPKNIHQKLNDFEL